MALELFTYVSDLRKLRKFYKRAPRLFAKATGSLLNDFAFGTRNTALEVLSEKMTVRNRSFANNRLGVDKTHKNLPISSQGSVVGSRKTKRFSGWREQETGEKTARERTITLLGRRGNKGKQLSRPARLNNWGKFEHEKKYPGRNVEHRTIVMMQALSDFKHKQPFVIRRKKGMLPGLYKFVKREPRLIQVFDPKRVQPKRIPWLTIARERYFRREDLARLWARTIDRILPAKL